MYLYICNVSLRVLLGSKGIVSNLIEYEYLSMCLYICDVGLCIVSITHGGSSSVFSEGEGYGSTFPLKLNSYAESRQSSVDPCPET